MRPTRFGLQSLVFYLAMLGAFFAAPYSNLFFLLLGFITLLGALGIWATPRNLRHVTAALGPLPTVPSGTGICVPVRLHAPRPTRFQVGVRLRLGGGRELTAEAELLDETATVALRGAPLPRGCYPIERARVESAHPFGLFRAQRAFDAPDELIVYPAPCAVPEGRSAVEAFGQLLGCAHPGSGDLQPASLRDHRDGDGVRRVHWRASARRQRLVVQECEGGASEGLEIVLDRRCGADELEESLATISALIEVARTSKETLRIHSQDLSQTYGDGQCAWVEALHFLARAQPLPDHAAAPPPTSPNVARLPRAHRHA